VVTISVDETILNVKSAMVDEDLLGGGDDDDDDDDDDDLSDGDGGV
jgi:hypothetical protein